MQQIIRRGDRGSATVIVQVDIFWEEGPEVTVSLSVLLSHLPSARVPDCGQQRVTLAAPMSTRTTRPLLRVTLLLVSLGVVGCAGSPSGALVDAMNRPGGLLAVVPCRHDPDIGDAVRSAVLVRAPKTCQAKWTHPTATQEQLVEDMKACSKAAFWVLSPTAAQDQRLECMASKGYRRDTQQNAAEPTLLSVTANADEAGPAHGLVTEPPPNPSSETATSPAPNPVVSPAAEPTVSPSAPVEGTSGREAQLKRLSNLRARGEITEDEYTILRRRVLETPAPTPERTSSGTTPAPPRGSGALGDLKWPPINSRAVMSVRTSGSFGSGWHLQTIYFLGERTWQGRTAFAFSDGSVTTYEDARRRTLARVKSDDALVESFEPYFVLADWPLVVGKSWPNRYRHNDYMRGRSFDDVQYGGKVEALEDVKTPAGTFKAFRIHLGGASSNYILWYSGDLGIFIKTRRERFSNHYLGSGVREAELGVYAER
jgi:Short C-terminal domain